MKKECSRLRFKNNKSARLHYISLDFIGHKLRLKNSSSVTRKKCFCCLKGIFCFLLIHPDYNQVCYLSLLPLFAQQICKNVSSYFLGLNQIKNVIFCPPNARVVGISVVSICFRVAKVLCQSTCLRRKSTHFQFQVF